MLTSVRESPFLPVPAHHHVRRPAVPSSPPWCVTSPHDVITSVTRREPVTALSDILDQKGTRVEADAEARSETKSTTNAKLLGNLLAVE